MKKRLIALLTLVTCVIATHAQDRYQATWESLKKYQTPDWFKDAKFGIFIHWGVYSVPAFNSEWYPRNMYQQGSDEFKHHVATYGPQSKFGYKDFIPQFKAEKFNADEWADLFVKSGAKYVVPVAEHHDGFAMYKTTLSKWNAAEMGPKRDIIGELSQAIKKKNIVFGLSSHRIEHWFFMNGGRKFDSDVNDPKYADFYGPAREENETMSPEYMNDWLLRCTELVDKYQPQLFWFDWWIEQPALDAYKKSFASYYYNKGLEWNKGVVINYKYEGFKEGTAVLDIERGKLTGIRDLYWQTDDAVGFKSWGYIPDESFKSPKYLITNLVDIVSKNGNLLLNIGPKPDGTIPQEQQDLLLAIGKWLGVNGEAIYGTRPWKTFGEGPTEVVGGAFGDSKMKPFTAQDIRFTTKGDALYAIALDVPKTAITVRSLAAGTGKDGVASVELVGSSEKVSWSQKSDGLVIQPLKNYPSENAVTYKILLKK
ncbi:alpha-L-fucosidase [Danxiaibacter flavus]|uniref:alpha-L-fucosidase n=1 Tax=Danxiaibacter flavus TaxID=3049108 RepID=A0ABV3ZE49_9BACT|nr:alpha-L-fucosidase [Chitinophagaceae bacterium DXS]